MEITSFGRTKQAVTTLNIHWTFYARIRLIFDVNPSNLPEVWPIEDFWSILKAKVFENNWETKTLHQLEVRVKKCLKEVDQVTILETFGCVKKRLNDIRMFDIFENRK